MKPLFSIVVAILVIATNAHSEPTAAKELAKSQEPVAEAEESEPQTRPERCVTCAGSLNLKLPNKGLANIQQLPQTSEIHTQQFFEECDSEKGCAGVKLKDGKVVERFSDHNVFKAAAAANSGAEYKFQAANNVFEKKLPNGGPFWWMNENSPFKNLPDSDGKGQAQKFSKFESSSYSTSSNGGNAGLDLAANPFLNGQFSKTNNAAFSSSGANFGSGQGFQSRGSEFESRRTDVSSGPQSNFGANSQSSFSSSQSGFSSQSGLEAPQVGLGTNQNNFNTYNSANKFASGFTGSSPAPFSPSPNVNLIQNSQKTVSEYDFEQQQQTQQNIDDLFASTGNVQGLDNFGGELQQTCAGQGYICVHKAQCNNGVVNTNGGSLLHANTQKQYCNTRTEVCCRLETASIGGSSQATLGISSATFSGTSAPDAGLFGQTGSVQNTGTYGSSSNNAFNAVNRESSSNGFASNTNQFAGSANSGSSQFESNSFGSNNFAGSTVGSGFGTTLAPTTSRFGANNFNNEIFKSNGQSNFIETDSFTAGTQSTGIYRPGNGPSPKPGIPYLPPVVDSSTSGSNIYSTSFTTTPRPFSTPRPISTPRPYTPTRVTPTFIPSTSAPGYLPPVEPLDGSESRPYEEGGVILDQFQPPTTKPRVPINIDIPAGCAAALKCTPIEFCTADGVISNTTVTLNRDQDAFRVPLTDCKDLRSGRIGKCCRDPYYTDPWPVNQLGKWVPDVFGGNDGKYIPDSRGSPNNPRPSITVRPPVTGSIFLNNFRTTQKPISPQGPNQVNPGFPSSTPNPTPGSFIQKTQFNQGSYSQGGRGQFGQGNQGQFGQGSTFRETTSSFSQGQTGQGAFGQAGRGQIGVVGQGVQRNQDSGFSVSQNSGQFIRQGAGRQGFGIQGSQTTGTGVTQGFGTGIRQGQGAAAIAGQGFGVEQGGGQTISQTSTSTKVTQGFGTGITQGQGTNVIEGQGFGVQRGQGIGVTQGNGFGVTQGNGFGISQGGGFGVTQGGGIGVNRGSGIGVTQGSGFGVSQGAGFGVSQGTGFGVSQGTGFGVSQGAGQFGSQGIGFNVREGQGFSQTPGFGVTQGAGFGFGFGQGQGILQGQGQALTEGTGEEVTEESVNRVTLSKYSPGECGIMHPQKPYGNRQDLEVDFAEIPWQAMVLLQTNRSLLCGGVITRPDVVITSASCVEGLLAKNVLIKGGEWKLGIDDEPLPYQIVQVKHILRHPFYKSGSLKYDSAVLVLTENLRLEKNIAPICLPSSSDTLDAFYNGAGECIVTGWGKIILQAHLQGSIMHGLNVSLINPEECESKIQSDYPHLLDNYEQDSCVCGQPTNPSNSICKVDTGSALACTTNGGTYTLRGIYSWESGCQVGNQLAAFQKFDLEWYEWCIGQIESTRFAQFTTTQITKNKVITQVTGSTFTSGVKGGVTSGVKGSTVSGFKGFGVKGFGTQGQGFSVKGSAGSSSKQFGLEGQTGFGLSQSQTGFNQFGKFTGSGSKFSTESKDSEAGGLNFNTEIKPVSKTFSATFTEKKFFQTEPKFVTYTTKPEIVTFTTKPEFFTYTTKPKIITYTTKPQIISYETAGTVNNPKYVSPGASFSEIVGDKHTHTAQCKCTGK